MSSSKNIITAFLLFCIYPFIIYPGVFWIACIVPRILLGDHHYLLRILAANLLPPFVVCIVAYFLVYPLRIQLFYANLQGILSIIGILLYGPIYIFTIIILSIYNVIITFEGGAIEFDFETYSNILPFAPLVSLSIMLHEGTIFSFLWTVFLLYALLLHLENKFNPSNSDPFST